MSRKLYTLILCSMTSLVMVGCGCARKEEPINLTKDTYKLELGETFQFDINNHFSKTLEEGSYTVDATSVNTEKLGDYPVVVTIGEENFTIMLTVKDTTKPVLTVKDETVEYLRLNTLDNLKMEDYVTVEDLTDCTLHYNAKKVGNAELITTDLTNHYFKDKKVSEDLNEDLDGFYELTVTAEDSSKNASTLSLYAVVDTVVPEVTFGADAKVSGDTIEIKEGKTIETTVTDNMYGTYATEDYTHELNDNQFHLVVVDGSGNTLDKTYTVKVIKEKKEETSSNKNDSNKTEDKKEDVSKNETNKNETNKNEGQKVNTGDKKTDEFFANHPEVEFEYYDSETGLASMRGWADMGNGYSLLMDGYYIDNYNYIVSKLKNANTPFVNEKDYWEIWIIEDCPKFKCEHGCTYDECAEERGNRGCDYGGALGQCANQYVQSLYGKEYTGYVANFESGYYSVRNNTTGEPYIGVRRGYNITVECPDGVRRWLDTDNCIKEFDENGKATMTIWKTPND